MNVKLKTESWFLGIEIDFTEHSVILLPGHSGRNGLSGKDMNIGDLVPSKIKLPSKFC